MNKNEMLAYTAGFVDGEGCIAIASHRDCRNLCGYYHELRMQVGITDVKVLELLEKRFGGRIHFKEARNEKHKPLYVWTLSSRKARSLLESLIPYLIIKLPQARLGVKFRKAKDKHIYYHNHPKVKSILDAESKAVEKMHQLNKRGTP